MKLSIVIPVYNVEKLVGRCLESCFRQDLPEDEYEVIVVNDGTPDNSMAVVSGYASVHSNIRIINKENGGLSSARNCGLAASCGDYVWFVDSDDWIESDCLGYLTGRCIDLNLDILSFCAATVTGDSSPVRIFSRRDVSVIEGREVIARGELMVAVPFSIYRRDYLIENGLRFMEGVCHEDSEFSPRAYYQAGRVSYSNRVVYFYFRNPMSMTHSFNSKRSFDSVGIVNRSIFEFAAKVREEDRVGFYDIISSGINQAFRNARSFDTELGCRFNRYAYENRYFIECLKKSSILKFRIEGAVFSIFPHNMLRYYKLMQIFNPKRDE